MAIKQKIFFPIERVGMVLEKFVNKATKEYKFTDSKGQAVELKAQPERYGVVVATAEYKDANKGFVNTMCINYELSKEDFDKVKVFDTVKAFVVLRNGSSTMPKPYRIITDEGEVLNVIEGSSVEDEEDEDKE